LPHARGVARERIAVAAGTRLLERYDGAVGELARRLPVNGLFVRSGVDDGSCKRSRFPSEYSPRREALALGQVGQLALVGQEAQVAPDAAAAAVRAGAGRVADEPEVLDHDRLRRLLRLHRDVRGVESPYHPVAAVARGAAAGAGVH